MRGFWSTVAGLVLLLGAGSSAAEECSVPVTPDTLASALEVGPTGSLPGQLAGVPFSVFSLESMPLIWPSCGASCVFTQPTGVTECGDLVSNPTTVSYLAVHPNVVQPTLLSNVAARQSANGRWTIAAQGIVAPNSHPVGASAAYVFELGTREIIDVASTGGTGRLPLDIGLRAGAHLGIQVCDGGRLRWNAMRDLRFRVSEQVPGNARRTLVSTFYSPTSFVLVDDVYSVEVTPGAAVTIDVYLRVSGNAVSGTDPFGTTCDGADVLLDMNPGIVFFGQSTGNPSYDGIQVQLSPDPALVLTPRSGIEYETVPEPDLLVGAATASLLLGAWKRRRDRHGLRCAARRTEGEPRASDR